MQHQSAVYLISGPKLGYLQSTLTTPVGDLLHGAPQGMGKLHFYLNVGTGQLCVENFRTTIVERGLPCSLQMVFNASVGWKINLDKRFKSPIPARPTPGQTLILVDEDGSELIFTYRADLPGFIGPEGLTTAAPLLQCTFATQQWVLFDPRDNSVEFYSSAGLRQRKEDELGQGIDFQYDANGVLSGFNGLSGLKYKIQHDSNTTTFLREIPGQKGEFECLQTHSFANSPQGSGLSPLLQRSKIGDLTIDFAYQALLNPDRTTVTQLSRVYQNDGAELVFQYTFNPYSKQQEINLISTLTDRILSIDASAATTRFYRLNDSSGCTMSFELDQNNRVIAKNYSAVINEKGFYLNSSHQYTYDAVTGMLTGIHYPDGSQESWQYATTLYKRCIQFTARTGRQEKYTYSDPMAAQADLTIKAVYADADPARAAVTRFVYDRIQRTDHPDLYMRRLRFEVAANGRVTEMVYPQTVYFLENAQVIGIRRFHAAYALQQVPVAAQLTLDDLSAWRALQNLSASAYQEILRGSYGEALRTTSYRRLDAQGKGDTGDNDTASITHLMMPFGQLKLESIRRGASTPECATTFVFSSSQEILLKKTDVLSRVTEMNYSMAVRDAKYHVTQPATVNTNLYGIQTHLKQLDMFGETTKLTVTAKNADGVDEIHTTQYLKAPNGSWLSETLVDGFAQYRVCDMLGRLVFEARTDGQLHSYSYIDSKNLLITRQLSKLIDMTPITRGKPLQPSAQLFASRMHDRQDDNHDRVTYTFNNPANLPAWVVDPEGYVTENRYDIWDNLITSILYATPLTVEQYAQVKLGNQPTPVANPTQDRTHQFFYNDDHALVAEQDAAGFVTAYQLNALNFVTQITHFATPTPLTRDLTQLFPAPSADDAHIYRFCNALGEVSVEIDADGFATLTDYTAFGKIARLVRTIAPLPQAVIDAAVAAGVCTLAPAANDHFTRFCYDTMLREAQTQEGIFILNAQGAVVEQPLLFKTLTYNMLDLVTWTETQDGLQPKRLEGDFYRAEANRYDDFGRLTHHANPNVTYLLRTTPNPDDQAKIWDKLTDRTTYSIGGLALTHCSPEGILTQLYYDAGRHLCVTVTQRILKPGDAPVGVVNTVEYNAFDDATIKRSLAQCIATGQWPTVVNGYLTAQVVAQFNALMTADDRVSQTGFDRRGLINQLIDAMGNTTLQAFNAFRELATQQIPTTSAQPSLTMQKLRDLRGNIVEELRMADGITYSTKAVYATWLNKPSQTINATGGVTQLTYKKRGLLATRSRVGIAGEERWEYDGMDRATTFTNALGNTTQYQHDDLARASRVISPIPTVWTEQITNAFNDLITQKDSLHGDTPVLSATHSPTGKPLVQLDVLGQKQEWQYSLVDDLNHYTNPQQRLDISLYDGAHSLLEHRVDATGINYVTQFTHSAFQETLETVDSCQTMVAQHHNKLGQCDILTRDPNGLKLQQQHLYAPCGLITQTAEGYLGQLAEFVDENQIDGFGRHVGSVSDPEGLAITTKQTLDGNDQVIVEENGLGQRKCTFFDGHKRRRFVMDPDGGLMEFRYNSLDQLVTYIHYVNRISQPAAFTSLEQLETAVQTLADPQDHQLWHFYDANNREVFSVTRSGSVIEQSFDAANQIAAKHAYATRITTPCDQLTTAELESWAQTHSDLSQDRLSVFLLDALGRQRFIVTSGGDAVIGANGGYLVEQRFDSLGNIVAKVEYAAWISAEQLAALVALSEDKVYAFLQAQQLLDPARDRLTLHQYDAFNREIWRLQPGLSPVIHGFTYRQDGLLTQDVLYATRPAFQTVTTDPAQTDSYWQATAALKLDPEQDRIREYDYDAARRRLKIRVLQGSGKPSIDESYAYNSADLETSLIDANGSLHKQDYDPAKRLIAKISPQVISHQLKLQNGQLVATATQDSHIQKLDYDDASRQTTVMKGLLNAAPESSATADYDNCSRLNKHSVDFVSVDHPEVIPQEDFALDKRPDILTRASCQKYYDGRHLQVCEVDEIGLPKFNAFNCDNLKQYEIDSNGQLIEYTYNSFNDITSITHYAIPLPIDLSAYITTGIPVAVIESHKQSSPEDRHRYFTHNHKGVRIIHEEGPMPYVDVRESRNVLVQDNDYPEASKADGLLQVPILLNAKKQTKYRTSAFGDIVELSILVAEAHGNLPAKWITELNWNDQQGNTVVTVARNGAVKLENRNAFGNVIEKIEYATPVLADAVRHMSLDEIKNYVASLASELDRHTIYEYDLNDCKTMETFKNQWVCELLGDPAQQRPKTQRKQVDISTSYRYDNSHRLIAKQNALGQWSYIYLNALGLKVAEIGFPVTTTLADGSKQVILPLTTFGYNTLGQEVVRTRYLNGAVAVIDPQQSNALPQPLQPDASRDQVVLTLRDGRGSVLLTQDANGVLKASAYRANGQLSRQWTPDEGYVSKGQLQSRLLETVFTYHPTLKTLTVTTFNEIIGGQRGQFDQEFAFANDFAESIGQGRFPGAPERLIRMGCDAFPYFDNQGGVNKLILRDLASREVVLIESHTKDLSKVNLDTFNQFTQQIKSCKDLCVQWINLDDAGLPTRVCKPQFFTSVTSKQAESISLVPITISSGLQHIFAQETAKYALCWRSISQTNIAANQIKVWPADKTISSAVTLSIVADGAFNWVDVSGLSTGSGLYRYSMDYYFRNNDASLDTSQVVGRSTGSTPIITGALATAAPFAVVMRDASTAELYGLNSALHQVCVFADAQAKQWVADLSVTAVPGGAPSVDLSSLPSGTYYLGANRQPAPSTLSMPLLVTSVKPTVTGPWLYTLSASQIKFKTMETHLELSMVLPKRYATCHRQVEIEYQSNKGPAALSFTIDPIATYPVFEDAQGNRLAAQAELPSGTWLVGLHKLTVSIEVLPGLRMEVLSSAQPIIGLTPPRDQSQPDYVRGFTFLPSNLLGVHRLQNPGSASSDYQIEVLLRERGAFEQWVSLSSLNDVLPTQSDLLAAGFFDISDLSSGAYQVRQRIGDQRIMLGQFNQGVSQWVTGEGSQDNLPQLAQPQLINHYDVWYNPAAIWRPGDDSPELRYYNGFNTMVQRTTPPIKVTDNRGVTVSKPLNYYYQTDILNRVIVTYSPSGGEKLTVLDEIGNEIFEFDPDETKPTLRTNYDGLGAPYLLYDSRQKATLRTFSKDGKHVLSTRLPSGRLTLHQLSSQSRLICQTLQGTNGEKISTFFDFDPRGFVRTSIMPGGQASHFKNDHTGQHLWSQDAAGRAHNYERDYFGRELSRVKPGGGKFETGYDFSGNMLSLIQTAGDGGYRLVDTPYLFTREQLINVDHRWLSFFNGFNLSLGETVYGSVQRLFATTQEQHFTYQPGHAEPVRIFDLANGNLTLQTLNLTGQVVEEKNYRSGADKVPAQLDPTWQLLAHRKSTYNWFYEIDTFMDTMSRGQLLRDEDGNHRATIFGIFSGTTNYFSHNESWFDYNRAQRVLKADCILVNNQIVPDKKNKRGLLFSYNVDYRVTQSDYRNIPLNIVWDDDGRLSRVAGAARSQGYVSSIAYNLLDQTVVFKEYNHLSPDNRDTTALSRYDDAGNGWLQHTDTTTKEGSKSNTSTTDFNLDANLGLIQRQTTYYRNNKDKNVIIDTVDNVYKEQGPGPNPQLVQLVGTRRVEGSSDKPPVCSANQFIDPNGDIVARFGVDDYSSNKQAVVYMSTANNRLIGTMSLRADSRFLIDGVAYYSPAWTPWEGLMLNETRAFYAGKGQPVASYEMKKDKDGNASGAVAIASYITSVTSETARQGGGTMVIGPEFFAGSSSAPTKLFAESSAADELQIVHTLPQVGGKAQRLTLSSEHDWVEVSDESDDEDEAGPSTVHVTDETPLQMPVTDFTVALDYYLTGKRSRPFDEASQAARDAKWIAEEIKAGPQSLELTESLRDQLKQAAPKAKGQLGDEGGSSGESIWDRIAMAAYKEEGLGPKLAMKNGYAYSEAPPIGTTIHLPPMLHNTYRANASPAYQEFVATMMKSFYPHMEIAKHKEHWWSKVLKIVVAVAIAVLSAGAATFLEVVLFAVLADVLNQGIGILDGAQQHFNFKEVAVSAAIAAASFGISNGVQLPEFVTSSVTNKVVLQAALAVERAVLTAVTSQLILLSTGMSNKFNLQAVAAAAVTAAFAYDPKVQSTNGWVRAAQALERDEVKELSSMAIEHKHFDVTEYLSNSFTDVVGGELGYRKLKAKADAEVKAKAPSGNVEVVGKEPTMPAEKFSKDKLDAETRQHLNKGMRQPAANDARSNAAAAPGKPTTKAMENGTAYHHKATLTSAGKHAQRFVQDDEGSSSASPTAGSQHRLFGGRQPAANASHSPLKAVAEGIIQASDRSAMYNLTEEKLLSFSEKFLYPIDNIVKPGIDLVHEMYKLAGDLSHSPQARKEFMQGIKSDLKDSIKSINKFYHEPVIDKYNDSVKFAGNGLFAGFGAFLPMKGLGAAAAGTVTLASDGQKVARTVSKVERVASTSIMKGSAKDELRSRVLSNVAKSREAREAVQDKFLLFSRRALARNFYAKGGWKSEDIDNHLMGIDFKKPVNVHIIRKGSILEQHQLPGDKQGNYFTKVGAERTKLGIYTSGREPQRYIAINDVETLHSTTANITDNWSMRKYAWDIELQGGGVQFFTHDLENMRPIP